MTQLKELSPVADALLLERSKRGDRNAYGQIVERYQTLVCSVAYNRCGDFSLSEDLAQEAFLKAWEKLADLRDAGKFKAWICSIVRNLTTRAAKRQRRCITGNASQLDSATSQSRDVLSPDERAVSEEEGRLVWQALEVIPETYREPMILFYRENQSVACVAGALELSQDAVKQRLSRGRQMLKRELTATIEKTLAKSKPSTAFTVAVVAGLSATMSTTAVAAGASTATAALAKSGGASFAKSSVGGLFTTLVVIPFAGLLGVTGWLYKTTWEQARSERERHLLKRFHVIEGCVLTLFAAAAFSSIWWQKFLPDSITTNPLLTGSVIPGLMIPVVIQIVWSSRRLSKQIERLREEEGTATPLRPLCEAKDRTALLAKTQRIFILGGLLVIAWPAALAIWAADWPVLGGMLAFSVATSFLASRFSLRFPSYSFQLYGISIAFTMLFGTIVTWWRSDVWTPGIGDLVWFLIVMVGMSTTGTVLTTLVWKKIYGIADEPNP